MAIAANKVPGVRATVAHDPLLRRTLGPFQRLPGPHLGQRVIGLELARRLVREWLGYAFDPVRHSKANVDEIVDYEGTVTD